jgi:hypothetical protein
MLFVALSHLSFHKALMKEGGEGDNLAVAWQYPGQSREVIPASYSLVENVKGWSSTKPTSKPTSITGKPTATTKKPTTKKPTTKKPAPVPNQAHLSS